MPAPELPAMEWDDLETQFPRLFIATDGNPRKLTQLIEGLQTIQEGHESGGLRNVAYQEAKSNLSRIAGMAWDKFFNAYITELRARTLPLHTEAFISSLSHHSLNEFRFLGKKLAEGRKAGAEGPLFEELVALEAEIAPLANLVIAMKNTVIKGRAPREVAVKISNPEQVRGTCACCFSNQAVVGAAMAHHGYQRPGDGYQTASCPGIAYQPFEKSPEGTIAIHQGVLRRISKLETIIKNPPQTLKYATSRLITSPQGELIPEEIEINSEHPLWPRKLTRFIRNKENEKAQAVSHKNYLEERLSNWAPQELKTVMGVPARAGIGGRVYTGAKPQVEAKAPSRTDPAP